MNYFFGFSYWKHDFIKPYFPHLDEKNIVFVNPFFKKNYFDLAIKKGFNTQSTIYIWGRKSFPKVEEYALEHHLKVFRIEDGFIRSFGLGSDLTQPYSLVVDALGIYFDPTEPSDLENILNNNDFNSEILERAKKLQKYMIEKKLSKYNLYENKNIDIPESKRVVLVPGQVEDDASIIYGANGMTNLELLQQARNNAPDAYIIYKPHPDVLVGNRKGNILKEESLECCDIIIEKASIDSVLEKADEVHTMTSLVGFEALLRGKKVYTYGLPFYAGWGLTIDSKVTSRRGSKCTLEELIAATLILYPSYIHPKTNVLCEVEVLLAEIDKEKKRYNDNLIYRFLINGRNFIARKTQFILKVLNW